MKNIKILRLELENFKCHSNLIIDFNGKSVSLFGDNAAGKTSVYDSLMWLLFGKDSHGNGEKNIEIKPLGSDGEVKDHNAITSVTCTFLVDGETVMLKRTLSEVWTAKRGSSELSYDGNSSEYYVDGVPVKKYVFSEKVNELVDEDTFRLLTNISYFSRDLSWQDRRAILFRVASVITDAEIMATDERFSSLISGMGRLSLDDYKKKLLSEKKGYLGVKNDIPARISECRKTVSDVEALDFESARLALSELDRRRESLDTELLAIEHDTAIEKKRFEIREAKLVRDRLVSENEAYRRQQSVGLPDVSSIRESLSRLELRLRSRQNALDIEQSYISSFEREINAARERWISVNSESFSGGLCPTCGQALPAAQLKAASDSFEAQKKKRLSEIEQTANARKEAKTQAEARILGIKDEIAQINTELDAVRKSLSDAESFVAPQVSDIEGYAESLAARDSALRILEGELADLSVNSSSLKAAILRELSEIKTESEKHRAVLSRESLLEYSKSRIKELEEAAKDAASALEAVESMICLIEEFTRYKTRFIEDSINSMFRLACFRLFREQANGGIEDRCDVVLDGVPYINLNNGAKINVGIDVINTLSRSYGVSVPLFIDNAESVTRLEPSDTQIIRLVVSENDKYLRCEYEN